MTILLEYNIHKLNPKQNALILSRKSYTRNRKCLIVLHPHHQTLVVLLPLVRHRLVAIVLIVLLLAEVVLLLANRPLLVRLHQFVFIAAIWVSNSTIGYAKVLNPILL